MKTALAIVGSLLLCLAGCAREKPAVLQAAGEAFQEVRSAVAREVSDPDRAKQGLGLVDEIERLLAEAHADLKAHNARIRNLNANYDATPQAFRAAFRDFNVKRGDRQRRMLEINQRGKALLTAAEWEELAKVREQALERFLRSGTGG